MTKARRRFLAFALIGFSYLICPALTYARSCEDALTRPAARLAAIREAATRGVTVVIHSPFKTDDGEYRKPTAAEKADLETMYGAKILIVDENKPFPSTPKRVSGLVIHLVYLREGIRFVQGEVNLFQSSPLYRELSDQKWNEYVRFTKNQPNVMSPTMPSSEVLAPYPELADYQAARARLRGSLDRFVTSESLQFSDSGRANLEEVLKHFLLASAQAFPNGAFIKYVKELETGDRGQLIHTPEADPAKLAAIFIEELERAKGESQRPLSGLTSKVFLERLDKNDYSAVHLVLGLLMSPAEIIVQNRVHVAKTRDNMAAEIRVDFASLIGPVNASLRYSNDVGLDYNAKAMAFFKELWKNAPPEVRGLSGGADVAVLEDGTLIAFEFNVGSESGFVDAGFDLVQANLFLAKLLGRPTPLIQLLESKVAASEAAQLEYLRSTNPNERSVEDQHHSIRDIYLVDAFAYIRDRMIENWSLHPNRQGADALAAKLLALANGQMDRIDNSEMRKTVLGMAQNGAAYMNEKLANPR